MNKIVDFIRDKLSVKLYDGQAEALSAYYESGCSNWLLLAGRRSGKSLLSDCVACFEALVPNFTDLLRPDEDRYILVMSTRLDGARLHIRNISKLLRRKFGKMIARQTEDEIRLTNGAVILSLPASARAGRGYTASALILDELAHFVDSLGNSSADAVYNALEPTLATFGERGRLVITTTPMSRTGIVYDLYDRAQAGELQGWHVTRKATRELNPKVSERTVNNALARDAESAQVEYFAEFRDPLENFFSSSAIEGAVDPEHERQEKALPGERYYAAIDPATMKDRYGFALAHQVDGIAVLDFAYAMRPPVDINAAEDLLFNLNERFKPYKIFCDTASTVERLKSKLHNLEYTPFTRPLKLKIYGNLKEKLNLGQLVLYREDDLINELKALQIRNGVDISAPKAGKITHDDLADCLALVVDGLVSGSFAGVTVVKDPFASWPPPAYSTYDPKRGWTYEDGITPMGEQAYSELLLDNRQVPRPEDPRQTNAREIVRNHFKQIREKYNHV